MLALTFVSCHRLGRRTEARAELELGARLCANQGERAVLRRKAEALA